MKIYNVKVKSKNDILKFLKSNKFYYNAGIYDKVDVITSFDEEMFRYCNKIITVGDDENSLDYDFFSLTDDYGWTKDWLCMETLTEI